MTILTTARLRLEPFNQSHLDGLQAMNSDPQVMRYITGRAETREETLASIARVKARWDEWLFSWWVFIERDSHQIIGAGCIQHLGRDAANPLEIGWRLRQDKWHQGFASEAAQEMARFAFETFGVGTLCAVCHPDNKASEKVMQRLGMQFRAIEHWYDADMLTYAMTRADWDGRPALPGRAHGKDDGSA